MCVVPTDLFIKDHKVSLFILNENQLLLTRFHAGENTNFAHSFSPPINIKRLSHPPGIKYSILSDQISYIVIVLTPR